MRWTRLLRLPRWLPRWLRRHRSEDLRTIEGSVGREWAEALRRDEQLVDRLLPRCRIPALRAVEPEPHWWGGHTVVRDPAPRLTSVQIVSGDPQAPDGPQVRVSTMEPEDHELVDVGGCEVVVDEETVAMRVVVESEFREVGAPPERWPRYARGTWSGYELEVQATGVPLEGLRLTRAGDLRQYRRQAGDR